ncbi:MAG: hypothetical protein K2X11_09170 [Acetobacteraceae bacterium]|nr:hypothetical protein [Acetobacteraceae bacterium]
MTTEVWLSLEGLIAEREARRAQERSAAEAEAARKAEETERFRRAIEAYTLTDADRDSIMRKIAAAFQRGEPELVLFTFPSDFCSDGGRRIASHLEDWPDTLPGATRQVYAFWHEALRPRGFRLGARIMNYPGGMPGDVGLVFSWPKELEG